MCILCVELEKDKMNMHEAYSNLIEMENSISEEHYSEVISLLDEKYKDIFDTFIDFEI